MTLDLLVSCRKGIFGIDNKNSDIPATEKNSYLPVESIFGKRTYPTHRMILLEMWSSNQLLLFH